MTSRYVSQLKQSQYLRRVYAVSKSICAPDPNSVHVGVDSVEHLMNFQFRGGLGKLHPLVYYLSTFCLQILRGGLLTS